MRRTARVPRLSVRSRVVTAVAIGLGVIVYLGVVLLYAADLAASDQRVVRLGDEGTDLALVVKPRGIDPVQQEFTFRVEVEAGSALVDDGTGLSRAVRVEIRDAREGNRTQRVMFGPDALSSETLTSTLSSEQRLEMWPFDRYAAELEFTVEQEDADGEFHPLAADLLVDGGVPGWDIGAGDSETDRPGDEAFDASVTIGRSFSTMAYAIVLNASLILMAVIALVVSISVLRRARQMELIFLGWIAGMLFAVPALRNFLPGQPPIGSWVDFLIVLWVVVSLIVSLAFLAFTWFYSRPSRPRNDPSNTGVADGRPN